jgi:hypothetical protein
MYPDSTPPTRRSFLDYLLGSTAVATLGAIVYPIFRFMSPPQIVESAENSVVAAKLSTVPPNSGKIFKFGNKVVGPGLEVSHQGYQAGLAALGEWKFRREALAVSLVFILFLAFLVYLKVRQIERRQVT